MKYLTYRVDGGPRVLLFPTPTEHREIAHLLALAHLKPESAGFVELPGGSQARVYGRSESLDLGPAPSDESLIEVLLAATLHASPPPGRVPTATKLPTV
jgi:hypothetical protein